MNTEPRIPELALPSARHQSRVGAAAAKERGAVIGWFREGSPAARRSLIAAALGWMLDAFDVMLFALVLSGIIAEFGLTITAAGFLGALTLVASGIGGIVFGIIADRYGRRQAMMLSILTYSLFTGLSGFAATVWQLAMCRVLVGLGMGGEWTSGAALVSETWPPQHRAKAIALMHSFWAIGTAAAAMMVGFVLPTYGWRAVFFIGAAPALLVLWMRRGVEESEIWLSSQRTTTTSRSRPPLRVIYQGRLGQFTVLLTLLSLFTLFAYWGLNFWVPAYLSLPAEKGGLALSTTATTQIVISMQVGMWLGLVTFGHVCDAMGRRAAYVLYLVLGAVFVLLFTRTHDPLALLVLGPLVTFFGTGQLSGFGVTSAEIYPTSVRAAAQGFTFNVGRVGSAFAPFIAGSLAQSHGFPVAFAVTAAALLLGAVTWLWLPETRGQRLVA